MGSFTGYSNIILTLLVCIVGLSVRKHTDAGFKLLLYWHLLSLALYYNTFFGRFNLHILNVKFLLYVLCIGFMFLRFSKQAPMRVFILLGVVSYLVLWSYNLYTNGIRVYASFAWSVWCVFQLIIASTFIIQLIQGREVKHEYPYFFLFFYLQLQAVFFGLIYLVFDEIMSYQKQTLNELMSYLSLSVYLLKSLLMLSFYTLKFPLPFLKDKLQTT